MTNSVLATQDQLSSALAVSGQIADAAPSPPLGKTFIYFVGFDGTKNIASDPGFSNDAQSSAVGELSHLALAAKQSNPEADVSANYFAGVGTDAQISIAVILPTEQSVKNAQAAYTSYAIAANNWINANPGGSLTAMMASFSRGSIAASIFAQMLAEKGLIYTDPETHASTMLIAPGEATVSANLMVSPVATGGPDNLVIPSNVLSTVVVDAADENRSLYHQSVLSQQGAINFLPPGNHGDIGDIYGGSGLGSIYLDGYIKYFSNAGLGMAAAPMQRQFDPATPAYVHSEPGSLILPFAPQNYPTDEPSETGTIHFKRCVSIFQVRPLHCIS